ncbi:hypothetical protein PCASD_03533 [Puccinia coronata f. sp. avenae]|uniref:Uncharacterized protein n=1 Tax=Puccinia coronata f. sp. avenae TaxID=200324 RepID=A0A2N5V7S4_9BASI|nr:hypothetical protein PCASD_03533 [Puccinia coronata f. sp. avenae]
MEDTLDEDPAITGAELKLKKKALGQTALFRSGPSLPRSKTVSATSEHKDKEKMVGTKWTNRKRCAYASLAVFLVYGVAGWFVLLTNYCKYSMADIYGLMTLTVPGGGMSPHPVDPNGPPPKGSTDPFF